jgi:hypothetical protein
MEKEEPVQHYTSPRSWAFDTFQAKGLARREHGFALLTDPNDVKGFLACHYEEKLRIVSKAVELISDDETMIGHPGTASAIDEFISTWEVSYRSVILDV